MLITTRADDDELLRALIYRTQGFTARQVETVTTMSHNYIRAATNRVLKADLAESGEVNIISAYGAMADRIAQ